MSRPTTVVTGVAGFIGSHLAERLIADGHRVVGIDAMRRPDDAGANLAALTGEPAFTLLEHDLRAPLPGGAVPRCATVFHLAGRPGVRGTDPDPYVADNVDATRHVLAAAEVARAHRVVFAGSSSVYGPGRGGPSRETDAPQPQNHYARTKLAAEELVLAHPGGIGLRYFSVYGPRQRPDMAFARFIAAARGADPAPLHQDGLAARDFTYVADVVDATVRAARDGRPGARYNVGAGAPVALVEALQHLATLLGGEIPWVRADSPVPEAARTWADAGRARDELGWAPGTALLDGLRAQVSSFEHSAATKVHASAG